MIKKLKLTILASFLFLAACSSATKQKAVAESRSPQSNRQESTGNGRIGSGDVKPTSKMSATEKYVREEIEKEKAGQTSRCFKGAIQRYIDQRRADGRFNKDNIGEVKLVAVSSIQTRNVDNYCHYVDSNGKEIEYQKAIAKTCYDYFKSREIGAVELSNVNAGEFITENIPFAIEYDYKNNLLIKRDSMFLSEDESGIIKESKTSNMKCQILKFSELQ